MDDWKLSAVTAVRLEKDINMLVSLFIVYNCTGYSGIAAISSTQPLSRIASASATISGVNNLWEILIPLSTAITIHADTAGFIQEKNTVLP